jgi:hypothetical protein
VLSVADEEQLEGVALEVAEHRGLHPCRHAPSRTPDGRAQTERPARADQNEADGGPAVVVVDGGVRKAVAERIRAVLFGSALRLSRAGSHRAI